MHLPYKPQPRIPVSGSLLFREFAHPLTQEVYITPCRRVQSRKQVQQGAFSAPGCPHQGHQFTPMNLEIKVFEDHNLFLPGTKNLGQVLSPEHQAVW